MERREKIQVTKERIMQAILDEQRDRIADDVAHARATVFSMDVPLPATGRDAFFLAATDRMSLFLKTYAPGSSGEIELHAHVNEDHFFIVLQGAACFGGKGDEEFVLRPHEGVLLPRGTMYRFTVHGDEPLVMIRIGAQVDLTKPRNGRVGESSQPFDAATQANNLDVTYSEGRRFT